MGCEAVGYLSGEVQLLGTCVVRYSNWVLVRYSSWVLWYFGCEVVGYLGREVVGYSVVGYCSWVLGLRGTVIWYLDCEVQ